MSEEEKSSENEEAKLEEEYKEVKSIDEKMGDTMGMFNDYINGKHKFHCNQLVLEEDMLKVCSSQYDLFIQKTKDSQQKQTEFNENIETFKEKFDEINEICSYVEKLKVVTNKLEEATDDLEKKFQQFM